MSKKLQNIKAIQQMLEGEHKFQTKKTVGFSDAKQKGKLSERHEVGDTWEETDAAGNIWVIEQRDGFRIRKTKNAETFQEIRDALRSFPKCRKDTCTCLTPNHLDEKMRKYNGMCYECTIDMEHDLRKQGKYDEYEKNRVRQNAEAWLRNAEQDIKLLKEAYTNASKFITNSEGEVETWSAKMTTEEFEEKVEREFEKFKEQLLNKLNGETNEND
jgi:hypothetical protein